MAIITRTVADLQVGDKLLLPETPRHDPFTVEIAILRPMRSGRVRIWVHTTGVERTRRSAWNYGSYFPTDEIERVED